MFAEWKKKLIQGFLRMAIITSSSDKIYRKYSTTLAFSSFREERREEEEGGSRGFMVFLFFFSFLIPLVKTAYRAFIMTQLRCLPYRLAMIDDWPANPKCNPVLSLKKANKNVTQEMLRSFFIATRRDENSD